MLTFTLFFSTIKLPVLLYKGKNFCYMLDIYKNCFYIPIVPIREAAEKSSADSQKRDNIKHIQNSLSFNPTVFRAKLFKQKLGWSITLRFNLGGVHYLLIRIREGRHFLAEGHKIEAAPPSPKDILAASLTRKILRWSFKCCWGRIPNPNFKVYLIAISRNREDRRLIFSM